LCPFLLAFQRHQFCCNLILEPKFMIKLLRRAHSGFFPKITNFCQLLFKFKIDLEFESIQK